MQFSQKQMAFSGRRNLEHPTNLELLISWFMYCSRALIAVMQNANSCHTPLANRMPSPRAVSASGDITRTFFCFPL